MTQEQIRRLRTAIRERTRRVEKNPEEARKVLQDIGILDADGHVESRYSGVVHLFRSERSATAD